MVNQKVAARLQVGPNCLLFFIDETGHETFADKNYPVFGLGGCAINSSSAAAVIAEPWRAMKAAHFDRGRPASHSWAFGHEPERDK